MRGRKLADLPLDVLGEAVERVDVPAFFAQQRAARAKAGPEAKAKAKAKAKPRPRAKKRAS